MTDDDGSGPTRMMRDLEKVARAERLLEHARGPATLEERRALRDSATSNEHALAAQMIRIRDHHLHQALACVAARCNDEDDAKKRIRIEQNDRSRRRLPVYVIWHDGEIAWEGAFELGVVDEGQATWRERWLTYASRDLEPLHRWRAEPRSLLADVEGVKVAKAQRSATGNVEDSIMHEGRGETDQAAVEALYRGIDAGAEQVVTPTQEQMQ